MGIVVIGLLSLISFNVVGKVRQQTDRAKCMANLRYIGTGFALFLQDNDNFYPGQGPGASVPNTSGAGSLRWTHRVGYYMDLPGPIITVNTGDSKEVGVLVRANAYEMESFHCPSTPQSAMAANNGSNFSLGLYGANSSVVTSSATSYNLQGIHASEVTDPAKTVLVGDRYAGGGTRAAVDEPSSRGPGLHISGPYPQALNGLAANHESHGNPALAAGSTHVLFCDGHVAAVQLEALSPWPNTIKFRP